MDIICKVCFWQDDGQDDVTADEVWGGPNHSSLTEARKNFAAYGACDQLSRNVVRPPTDKEQADYTLDERMLVDERLHVDRG